MLETHESANLKGLYRYLTAAIGTFMPFIKWLSLSLAFLSGKFPTHLPLLNVQKYFQEPFSDDFMFIARSDALETSMTITKRYKSTF